MREAPEPHNGEEQPGAAPVVRGCGAAGLDDFVVREALQVGKRDQEQRRDDQARERDEDSSVEAEAQSEAPEETGVRE